jgi:site-specific DNA recombinase
MYSTPIMPRRGEELQVLIIARISTLKQDELSLADQVAFCKQKIREIWDGPVAYRELTTQASGERTDRPELEELRRLVRTRTLDIVIAEDIGRILRRQRVHEFGELCEDHDTRLIAINDMIDTADESWRMMITMLAMHHERHVEDSARRVHRSMANRFLTGQLDTPPVFGYRTDADGKLGIDEPLRPFVTEMFYRVESGESFASIATDFNARGVPLRGAPTLKATTWSGAHISKLVRREIYKGLLRWGATKNRRINETGRRVPIGTDKSEQLTRTAPHLALIDPERFDRIGVMLQEKNGRFSSPAQPLAARRGGFPRQQESVFPSTHLRCGHCGRKVTASNNGSLRCSGGESLSCWTSSCGSSRLIAARALGHVQELVLETRRGRDELCREITDRLQRTMRQDRTRVRRLEKMVRELGSEQSRLIELARSVDTAIPELAVELSSVRRRLESTRRDLDLARLEQPQILVPPTLDRMIELAGRVIETGDLERPDFFRAMSQAMPRMFRYMFRPFRRDSMQWLPRIAAAIDLSGLLPPCPERDVLWGQVHRVVTFDGFAHQPWMIQLPIVRDLFAEGLTKQQVADEIGYPLTYVKEIEKVLRKMEERGTDDYLEPLVKPLPGGRKHRRHTKPGYEFRPLDGFTPWDGSWPVPGHLR